MNYSLVNSTFLLWMMFNSNIFLIAFPLICVCKSTCGLTIWSFIFQINEDITTELCVLKEEGQFQGQLHYLVSVIWISCSVILYSVRYSLQFWDDCCWREWISASSCSCDGEPVFKLSVHSECCRRTERFGSLCHPSSYSKRLSTVHLTYDGIEAFWKSASSYGWTDYHSVFPLLLLSPGLV